MEDRSREVPPAPLSDVEGYPLLVMLGLPVVENGKQILRNSELPEWLTHWDRTDIGIIPREPTVDALSAWFLLQVKVLEHHEIQEANTFSIGKSHRNWNGARAECPPIDQRSRSTWRARSTARIGPQVHNACSTD